MIVLDTNVVSELMKRSPQKAVVAWLDAQPSKSIWTTSITVFEIFFGIETLPGGKRQTAIRKAFESALENELEGRVLNFDLASASESAMISAALHRVGRPVDVREVQIAGIVSARHATLATRNTKHFADAGVALVDPWAE